MECYTYLRNVTDLWKTPYERRFGKPFEGPIVPFGSLVEYHPITAKDQSRIHQFRKKESLTWMVPWKRSVRGVEFGRVTYWLQTLRSWRRWTHQKSTRKDSMRKKWYFPKKKNLLFQSKMDESKHPEEIRNWEHPPWYGRDQFKEKIILTFLENQKGLLHNLMTHFRMPVTRWTIFSPCREASYTAITLNPESNFTRREKNHSLFHWSTLTLPELLIRIWMSSKRSALMIIGTLMALETCLILGQFHTIYSTRWKSSWRIYLVRWEIDEKTAYIQPRSSMARVMEVNGKERQAERKAKMVWRQDSSWQRTKIAWNLFHRPRG